MIVFRLVHKDRISLDGEGASRFPGRWNPPNVPCLYTSASPSLAQLEVMANIEDWQLFLFVPYVVLHIFIPDRNVIHYSMADLPSGWDSAVHPEATQQFGGKLLSNPSILAFSVPSVLSPLERNLIINPASSAINKITVKKITAFKFDSRLLRG